MEYTKEQTMAMSKVLLDILCVDKHIDPRETIFFEKVKQLLNISTQEHYEVMSLNTLKCLSIIKKMDESRKLEFAKMMREMILADKYIDPNEAETFYDICEFIRIDGVGLS